MINTRPPALRLVLGDQLSESLSALDGADLRHDIVLMLEVRAEGEYVRHHPQKIVMILAAMRHFASVLRSKGYTVDYVKLDDPDNTGSFDGEVRRALARHHPAELIMTEPGEWRVLQMMEVWQSLPGITVSLREDTRFLCSRTWFSHWAGKRTQWRMEHFYREMRRRTGWLMEHGNPVGGEWNYDNENRKALPRDIRIPPRPQFLPDALTRDVMALVAGAFPDHFGDIEPFHWPVTREDALHCLEDFITHRLPLFGDYQDAMRSGEDSLFHSLLSPALNIGLLSPREVCEAALEAWRCGRAPLNAVEGFVRQILGWREYIRGIYWHSMPDYADTNVLGAERPLPAFFWGADTPMNCLTECIRTTRQNAYAHHIQRLMVIGNFALLAGLAPKEVEAWYLAVYADAFEWVELPNTHGMVLHADGGKLASKPYAASGAWIKRMSDYCQGCRYNPDIKEGPDACPFNYLYWDFLDRHTDRLAGNPRMAMPYRNLSRFSPDRLPQIRNDSKRFLDSL